MKKFINSLPKPLVRLVMLCLVVLLIIVVNQNITVLIFKLLLRGENFMLLLTFALGVIQLTRGAIKLLEILTKQKNETD